MAMMIFKPPADFWVDQTASHKISATHKASEDNDEAGWIQGYILIINRIQRCKRMQWDTKVQGFNGIEGCKDILSMTWGVEGQPQRSAWPVQEQEECSTGHRPLQGNEKYRSGFKGFEGDRVLIVNVETSVLIPPRHAHGRRWKRQIWIRLCLSQAWRKGRDLDRTVKIGTRCFSQQQQWQSKDSGKSTPKSSHTSSSSCGSIVELRANDPQP